MACGQLPVGGCDLDLTHAGPCVIDGRLTKTQRARMTTEEADRVARFQVARFAETDPDRKVPDPPPDASKSMQRPSKYAARRQGITVPASGVTTMQATSNLFTTTNASAITAHSIGSGQYTSTDTNGITITWNLTTAGQLVFDQFGNTTNGNGTWPATDPSRLSAQSWEESQKINGGYALRPPHPALGWKRCGDAREHRPHRGSDNQTNCPGRTRPFMTDRNDGSWRSRVQVERELRANPIPQEFVICACGCACECDGEVHFTDQLCACFYLHCACVVDLPDEPAVA